MSKIDKENYGTWEKHNLTWLSFKLWVPENVSIGIDYRKNYSHSLEALLRILYIIFEFSFPNVSVNECGNGSFIHFYIVLLSQVSSLIQRNCAINQFILKIPSLCVSWMSVEYWTIKCRYRTRKKDTKMSVRVTFSQTITIEIIQNDYFW